jgi:hypothetical protein
MKQPNKQVKKSNKQIKQSDERMEQFNKHYPVDYDLMVPLIWKATCDNYIKDIREDLALAKAGYTEAESQLCDKLGTIRRSIEHKDLNISLLGAIDEAVGWLLSVGYNIDFRHPDPAMWITTRDGKPRF